MGKKTVIKFNTKTHKGIQQIFAEVPKTYELINHLLTLFLDIRWRRKAAKSAVHLGSSKMIDLCCGTGETAAYLNRFSREKSEIFALDFSLPMLRQALAKRSSQPIHFIQGDIHASPFPSATFDAATITFASRNLNRTGPVFLQSLRGIYRILKPGGCLIHLETSQPSNRIIKKIFHFYVKTMVKPIGGFISGSKSGYSYLSQTIPRFYSPGDLEDILYQAGFRTIVAKKLCFGIAALHVAYKSES